MPLEDGRRPDPEQLLQQFQAAERKERRGKLKVFLGYSSGVGKSFRMLDEGRRRSERGEDVVVGGIQPKFGADVKQVLQTLPVIPLKVLAGGEVIDIEAILKRRPQVCLIDGLAYDNPAGCRRARRWQDVDVLLSAGISVITSLNLHHIEEHREQVFRITGKLITQTVPKVFLQEADEIVIVDAPPELLMGSAADGDEDAAARRRQLSELREVALLLAAEVVDRQLEDYLQASGIEESWGTQERIAVCVTPRANGRTMIASGKRNKDRFHGDLYVIHVRQPGLTPEDQVALDEQFRYALECGAQLEKLDGEDPIAAIVQFARSHGITQIFIGHSLRQGWRDRLFGGPVDRLIRAAQGMDVRVFPH